MYTNIVDMYSHKEDEDIESLLVNGGCEITSIVINTSDGNSITLKPTEISGLLHITNRRKQKIQVTIKEEFISSRENTQC